VFDEGRLSCAALFAQETKDGADTLGAGVVWDQTGHVVVSLQAVARALGLEQPAPSSGSDAPAARPVVRSLRVRLLDASTGSTLERPALLAGASAAHGLAVLRLLDCPQEALTPVPLAGGSDARVGQAAFAVGVASLSVGCVSGLGRALALPAGLLPGGALQTDAVVVSELAGAPLLDSSGRLLGLLLSPGKRGGSGLFFAVPVSTLAVVVPQLIAFGHTADA